MLKLSIVIPVYFNEQNLHETYNVLKQKVFEELIKKNFDYELIFVDDGSLDDSYKILLELKQQDSKIKIIKLSRNFGSINACFAGISIAKGDCLVQISADLQDPPELILNMLEKWQKGYKITIATRQNRDDPFFSKICSLFFYKIFRFIAQKNIPKNGFDYYLIDKKVIDFLKSHSERNTFLPSLVLWSGYKYAEIPYDRKKRSKGKSRWTFAKKFNYFVDSITAFSYTPIRFVTLIGIILAFLSTVYLAIIFVNYFFNKSTIQGWPSLASLIVFSFGVQMMSIGIIGEYLWRTLDTSRARPNYIIEEIID